MYEKLSVKDLWKYCHVWPDDNPYDVHKLVAEAAEAIEKLQSELKQVKAERDAAIKDMKNNDKCSICLFREIPLNKCRHYYECGLAYEYFQWRGPQD